MPRIAARLSDRSCEYGTPMKVEGQTKRSSSWISCLLPFICRPPVLFSALRIHHAAPGQDTGWHRPSSQAVTPASNAAGGQHGFASEIGSASGRERVGKYV